MIRVSQVNALDGNRPDDGELWVNVYAAGNFGADMPLDPRIDVFYFATRSYITNRNNDFIFDVVIGDIITLCPKNYWDATSYLYDSFTYETNTPSIVNVRIDGDIEFQRHFLSFIKEGDVTITIKAQSDGKQVASQTLRFYVGKSLPAVQASLEKTTITLGEGCPLWVVRNCNYGNIPEYKVEREWNGVNYIPPCCESDDGLDITSERRITLNNKGYYFCTPVSVGTYTDSLYVCTNYDENLLKCDPITLKWHDNNEWILLARQDVKVIHPPDQLMEIKMYEYINNDDGGYLSDNYTFSIFAPDSLVPYSYDFSAHFRDWDTTDADYKYEAARQIDVFGPNQFILFDVALKISNNFWGEETGRYGSYYNPTLNEYVELSEWKPASNDLFRMNIPLSLFEGQIPEGVYVVDRNGGDNNPVSWSVENKVLVFESKNFSGELFVIALSGTKNVSGDANLDGYVNIVDILLVRDFIFGTKEPTPEQFQAADVNGDGKLDINDILAIRDIIFGL